MSQLAGVAAEECYSVKEWFPGGSTMNSNS